jgi:hypothetical protein
MSQSSHINAALQARPKVGAQRTLEGVGSRAGLGGYSGRQWYSTSGADSGGGLRPNLTALNP